MKWYLKAAEQRYAKAQYNIAILYHNGRGVKQDSKKAMSWYLNAAEQEYAPAQRNFGSLYQDASKKVKNEFDVPLATIAENGNKWALELLGEPGKAH